MDFFAHGRLNQGFNCSIVALIPKSNMAMSVKDYKPISCCTIIYKIISKILNCRQGEVMQTLVNKNQAPFVKGQHFQDHVLLAYELIRGL